MIIEKDEFLERAEEYLDEVTHYKIVDGEAVIITLDYNEVLMKVATLISLARSCMQQN